MVTCTGEMKGHQHPLIAHNEFFCPLCIVLEDMEEIETTISNLRGEVVELTELVEELNKAAR